MGGRRSRRPYRTVPPKRSSCRGNRGRTRRPHPLGRRVERSSPKAGSGWKTNGTPLSADPEPWWRLPRSSPPERKSPPVGQEGQGGAPLPWGKGESQGMDVLHRRGRGGTPGAGPEKSPVPSCASLRGPWPLSGTSGEGVFPAQPRGSQGEEPLGQSLQPLGEGSDIPLGV